jgi:hypothetical protein
VHRHGRYDTLSWRATGAGGTTLRFSDVGPYGETPIITTRRSHGSARFTPVADGVGGRHHIGILATQHGLPRAVLRGHTFRVPRPAAPARPRAVRLHRSHHDVILTWKRESGAVRYRVLITTTDGRRKIYQLPATHHRLAVHRVFAPDTVTAQLRAIARDGRQSRTATTKLHLA